ncbi:thioredoxin domain-containing protein [Sphingomonas sp. ASV193]|uniref:DsbA family protein n=1 Tax=Sphingomonas sp. ASV193 TaxID=3144405 RepID=UPI0032E8E2F4
MRLAAAFAALILFTSAALARPAHVQTHAAVRDWSRTVVATPEGGMRMGNPAARVRLVEYGSLSCPHCRYFEQTGYPKLVKDYVRTGKVSYEFRNLLLDAADIAVSRLAQCAGPARFFPMAAAVFDAQPGWHAKVAALDDSALAKLSDTDRLVTIANTAGFFPLAARFGVSPARARACLADQAGLEKLYAVTRAASGMGVDGTPTFFVNGKMVGARAWEQLEPLLK